MSQSALPQTSQPRPVLSILFTGDGLPVELERSSQPRHFADLNLDQVIAAVIAGRDEYALMPFFHWPLTEVDAIRYRQEVFQDIERRDLHDLVTAFAQRTVVAKFGYGARQMQRDASAFGHYHRARWFLNAVEEYCAAVTALASGLAQAAVRSRGLCGLRDFLQRYVGSEAFTDLHAETQRLEDALAQIRYCIVIKGDRVTVGRYDDEEDYSEQVTRTFERFQQGAPIDYRDTRPAWKEEDFAEIAVLDLVSRLYPDLFAALDGFCQKHASYLDPTVALADRELQFYLSYLDHIQRLREAGLPFTYPLLSLDKQEQTLDTFDLALAAKLVEHGDQVVCNDFELSGAERILVISGPNNGGKTTLARTFGQLHYLARLGCPVPGREARLFVCDQIFTHFEREEDITTLAGKLQEELNRLRADLDLATPASVVILNEVFNSTTAHDALFLSQKILERICELDALGVCVTFLEELSTLNQATVSMVSQVAAHDPATRTHKVIRVPADGRAYARAIAQKYGLTYEQITADRSVR